MAGKTKVVNHRGASVHIPGPERKHIELYPGVNHVDTEVWEEAMKSPSVKGFLEDEYLEVDGKPQRETIPSIREYVEAGYEPKTFMDRFPNAKVSEDELIQAQVAWDNEKESARKVKKNRKSREE